MSEQIFAANHVLPVSSPAYPKRGYPGQRWMDRRCRRTGREFRGQSSPDAEVRTFSGGSTIIPGAVSTPTHTSVSGGKMRRREGRSPGWLSRLISRLPEKEAWTPEAARDSAIGRRSKPALLLWRSPRPTGNVCRSSRNPVWPEPCTLSSSLTISAHRKKRSSLSSA